MNMGRFLGRGGPPGNQQSGPGHSTGGSDDAILYSGGGMSDKTMYLIAKALMTEDPDQLDKLGAIRAEHYGAINYWEWVQEFFVVPLTGHRDPGLDTILRKARNTFMSITGKERKQFFNILNPLAWIGKFKGGQMG
jgi:hypothetical protein